MKTRAKLMPGQKGTKTLLQKYGDAFVCVRYRYDEKNHKQYKTVELIVSEKDWSPPPSKFPESAIVPLKIRATENTLQKQAKALGGRWDPDQKVWYIPYGCVVGTNLEKLIVEPTKEKPETPKSL
jgi:hypothetical protein